MAIFLASGTLFAGVVVAVVPASSGVSASLTPEQTNAAREIVANKCTACHSLAKASSNDPSLMVDHMRKKAKLGDQDLQTVVPYLAALRSRAGTAARSAVSRDEGLDSKRHGKNRKHKEKEREDE